MPAWSDAAGQDESHRAEPPKNRSTKTAYQKLVRSPSATPLASSDPIIPFSLPQGIGNLRFHPRCYYRPEADAPTETWPAMIAAVTDLSGHITGAHRTWLDPSGRDKAPVDTPRRAMGHLLGHAVRFGLAGDVMAAGEGIETMLSLRCVVPSMAMVAALSAAHLAAILFPATLRRLYIVRDDDRAGDGAVAGLFDRAQSAGIEAMVLSPQCGGFNEDLRNFDINVLCAALRIQLAPEDVARFLSTRVETGIGYEALTPP